MNPILLDFPDAFESERLVIRCPRAGDGAALHEAVTKSLDELRPWMPWAAQAPSVADEEAVVRRAHAKWLLREDLMMVLLSKETGQLLGGSGLHRIDWDVPKFEIGYWLRTSCTGHGYMTEAVNAITAFAFDMLKARRLEIRMDSRNTRSQGVAERCGFTAEGYFHLDALGVDEHPRDTRIYAKAR